MIERVKFPVLKDHFPQKRELIERLALMTPMFLYIIRKLVHFSRTLKSPIFDFRSVFREIAVEREGTFSAQKALPTTSWFGSARGLIDRRGQITTCRPICEVKQRWAWLVLE